MSEERETQMDRERRELVQAYLGGQDAYLHDKGFDANPHTYNMKTWDGLLHFRWFCGWVDASKRWWRDDQPVH